jgi:hypothetical protein
MTCTLTAQRGIEFREASMNITLNTEINFVSSMFVFKFFQTFLKNFFFQK